MKIHVTFKANSRNFFRKIHVGFSWKFTWPFKANSRDFFRKIHVGFSWNFTWPFKANSRDFLCGFFM